MTTLQEIIDELNVLITDLSAEFYETFDHHLQRRLQAVEAARDIIIGYKEVADSISDTFGLPVEVLLGED